MLHAVIMAGGAGTRFWPASRQGMPKQLLRLTGERSMLQATRDRLGDLCPPSHTWVVTNQALVAPVREQLPELPPQCVLGEPAKRDTAPCIGLAATLLAARDPDATMLVMPADHVIASAAEFRASVTQAVALVDSEPRRIVTFGIKPTVPAEVFGYIERGAEVPRDGDSRVFEVARFREKPDRATAESFLAAGTFFWNSGIFVWKARTILDALAQREPVMAEHLERIGEAWETPDWDATLVREFSAIEGKSIDYAVMENYQPVLVVEAPFDWDDLGNWSALPRLNGQDSEGNTVSGRHLGIATRETIVRTSDEHLVVTVGLDHCLVVHTDNATLVLDRRYEGQVGEIVKQLRERGWTDYL